MARPKKTKNTEDTEMALLRAATEVFGRVGFEAASLSEISASVGVTRTTLLYYFKSKENIYTEIIKQSFSKLATELLASIASGGSARLQITRVVKRFLNYVEGNPSLAKLMLRELIDECKPGARFIIDQGLPVLDLVEQYFMELGQLDNTQRPLLREILLQIMTTVMLKSAAGSSQERIWGKKPKTGELASILLDGLMAGNASPVQKRQKVMELRR